MANPKSKYWVETDIEHKAAIKEYLNYMAERYVDWLHGEKWQSWWWSDRPMRFPFKEPPTTRYGGPIFPSIVQATAGPRGPAKVTVNDRYYYGVRFTLLFSLQKTPQGRRRVVIKPLSAGYVRDYVDHKANPDKFPYLQYLAQAIRDFNHFDEKNDTSVYAERDGAWVSNGRHSLVSGPRMTTAQVDLNTVQSKRFIRAEVAGQAVDRMVGRTPYKHAVARKLAPKLPKAVKRRI